MKKVTILAFCGLFMAAAQAQVINQTFNYTGSPQIFVVPPGIDSLYVETWGAQGGQGTYSVGGLGGYADGLLGVSTGDTLFIYVGGMGFSHNAFGNFDFEPPGGWNGGGKGGYDNSGQVQNGGGGGGASDIRYKATALSDRKIVAGGGGGGAGGFFSWPTAPGGAGGGLNGGDGAGIYAASSGFGRGGTQTSGGIAATTFRGATDGSLGNGGFGSTNQDAWGSGGGGGGYYGGSGGTSLANHGSGHAAGGGGGSSYLGGVSQGSTTSGVRSGNGMVVIQSIPVIKIKSITQPTPGQSNGSIDVDVVGSGNVRFSRWTKTPGFDYPGGSEYDLNNVPAGQYYLMLITRDNRIIYSGPHILGPQ